MLKATALVTLATIILVVAAGAVNTAVATTTTRSTSLIDPTSDIRSEPKAPMAVSQDGNNVYIVWWTN